jgi:hypothetical protein
MRPNATAVKNGLGLVRRLFVDRFWQWQSVSGLPFIEEHTHAAYHVVTFSAGWFSPM